MWRLMLLGLVGCAVTGHPVVEASLGTPSRSAALLAVVDEPGPLVVESVNSADWHVPLSGMLDLDDPRAAGIEDREEPIHVYFHVIRHPTFGTFIIDTGIERAVKAAPDEAALSGFAASFMHVDDMQVHEDLATFIAHEEKPLAGVFFTHLHSDHIAGLRDVPPGTPLYAGAGEAAGTALMNVFTRGIADRAFAGQAPLEEWAFTPDPDGDFAGVVDVFGDGSFWALHLPGHTAGSTAYLARTANGPVLFTGDVCHTAWGWEHDVTPGTYTADHERNGESLAQLRRLVASHPRIDVRLGHQELVRPVARD